MRRRGQVVGDVLFTRGNRIGLMQNNVVFAFDNGARLICRMLECMFFQLLDAFSATSSELAR
jgi:hypothetical protein